jgi:hypothetical protein
VIARAHHAPVLEPFGRPANDPRADTVSSRSLPSAIAEVWTAAPLTLAVVRDEGGRSGALGLVRAGEGQTPLQTRARPAW